MRRIPPQNAQIKAECTNKVYKQRIYTKMSQPRKIELLAPAKDAACARIAIDCGADAVYIGAGRFGARRAAGNSLEEIKQVIDYAHLFGVKVYATLNTVLYDSELADAEALARELIAAGIDAIIIQDMALRQMNLPIEMHASTQVAISSAEDARFFEQCGFSRLILERSLSLEEIRAIRQATTAELECFIHGAICVGHSGRCFLSRSTSERSGNRGECSQPCRLPYDLVDERGRKILEGKHLLSVRDFNLSSSLEDLIDAGVSSFKIEGRLKDAGYVKNIVSHYRRLLDDIIAQRDDICRSSVGRSIIDFQPNPAKSFTRGASEYMLYGKRAGVASFNTPKAVGEYLGKVESISRSSFKLDSAATLSAGDGICIICGGEMRGTNINRVEGKIITPNRMEGIAVGVDVFRNYDHQFSLTLERARIKRTLAAKAILRLSSEGISLKIYDQEGLSAEVHRDIALEQASNPEKMQQTALRAIEKSGGTIFDIEEVKIQGQEWFAQASILSDMRREALEQLSAKRAERRPEQKIFADNPSARYPRNMVSRYENVTNHLAREFYILHGAEEIEPALEVNSTRGERVMVSSYCIRREIGECLKERPSIKGNLYIEHGTASYRLEFDCQRCQMMLYDHRKSE